MEENEGTIVFPLKTSFSNSHYADASLPKNPPDPDIPLCLIDDIAAGKCLPVIGAGFSLNAELSKGRTMPDWRGLTQILAASVKLPASTEGPKVASEYERQFGRVQLIESIRQALYTDHVLPGDCHKVFVKLPFDVVYTTNFDLILENACNAVGRPYRSLVGSLQMPFHGGHQTISLIKMHGDLRHEEHIIVTEQDYKKYLKMYAIIATHLSAMLITRTPIFIGYSLSDPDFQQLRNVVRSRLGRFVRMAYVVQFDAKQSDIDAKLKDMIHIISLSTTAGKSKGEVLTEFFQSIQAHLDARAARELRDERPEVFKAISTPEREIISKAEANFTISTSSSNLCLVLMPFESEFDMVYRQLIEPVAEGFGLTALRGNEIYASGPISEQIKACILQARLCIADVTGANPDVLYEVRTVLSLGKPLVVISRDDIAIPFAAPHQYVRLKYERESFESAKSELEILIQYALSRALLREAEQLLKADMYRGAIALLGILLEQSLQQLVVKNKIHEGEGRRLHRLSMAKSVELLSKAGVIKSNDAAYLYDCIGTRNSAVHKPEEPSKDSADFMFRTVKEFISKYLDPEFYAQTEPQSYDQVWSTIPSINSDTRTDNNGLSTDTLF